ncbi:DUF1294 domain-containing protein [Inhella gelatinilytica]|uniref:DUF1294 domain-containing protein n=1 Tax=Inhella gelatinilytica TaxID=2795030 RepID=UPI002872DA80|nr:DUF1294 domain-containing protein [Inhella gelatinilytica]
MAQWDDAKGLGFVQAEGAERALVRRADLSGRLQYRAPRVGEPVSFQLQGQGRSRRAIQVRSLEPSSTPVKTAARPASQPASSRLLVLPVFAVLLGAIHLAWPLPRPVPLLYGALSTALFILYGLDKWAAVRGRDRIAEASLHALALLGGWPGALLGQQVFRHKTAKPVFLRWTWGCVALNVLLLVTLCTPAAVPIWRSIAQAMGWGAV